MISLNQIQKRSFVLLGLLLGLSSFLGGADLFISAAIGGLISMSHLALTRIVAEKLLLNEDKRSILAIGLLFLKNLLIVLILWSINKRFNINIAGLLLGLSVSVVSIMIEAIVFNLRPQRAV